MQDCEAPGRLRFQPNDDLSRMASDQRRVPSLQIFSFEEIFLRDSRTSIVYGIETHAEVFSRMAEQASREVRETFVRGMVVPLEVADK